MAAGRREMNDIAENIHILIKQKGLLTKSFAESIGYKPNEFSNMLHGRKTIKADDVKTIATGLGVTPDVLFGIKPYEIIVTDKNSGLIADITDEDAIVADGCRVQRKTVN